MKLRLDLIGGELALSESEVAENRGHHGAAGVRLDEKRQAVRAGWGAERGCVDVGGGLGCRGGGREGGEVGEGGGGFGGRVREGGPERWEPDYVENTKKRRFPFFQW